MIDRIKTEKNWYQKCHLIYIYHQFKVGSSKRPNKWTIKNTAIELGLSVGFVSESLKIAESQVTKECKSRNDALKRIRS